MKKYFILFCLTLLLIPTICFSTDDNPRFTLLAAGQSNIDGRCAYALRPDYLQEASIPYCYINRNSKDGKFTAFTLENRWAFDAVVYHHLSQALQDRFYVIKWSQGNTSIDAKGANNRHWTPHFNTLDSMEQSLLMDFTEAIQACQNNKAANLDIKAFIWHQGEGDRNVSERYYNNLKDLIHYVRTLVGKPELPFITGTFSHKSGQYRPTVEAALLKLASEDPNMYVVDLSKAELMDRYHFNAEWSEYFGEKVFNLLIESGALEADPIPTQIP